MTDNRDMDRQKDGQRRMDGQRWMDEQRDRQKDGHTVQTIMVNYLSATKRLLTSLRGEGL